MRKVIVVHSLKITILRDQFIRAFYLGQRPIRKHPGLIIDSIPVNIHEGESLAGDLFIEAALLF
jgi:hypothetical protein